MEKTVMCFVISFSLFMIAIMIKRADKNDNLKMKNYKRTSATIERVILSEAGNVYYYVSFLYNGNKLTAHSNHYTSNPKSLKSRDDLNIGDEVEIGYFFTKGGTPRVVIFDERLIPISVFVVPIFSGLCAFRGIIFFLGALLSL